MSEDTETKKKLIAEVFSRAAGTYGQVGPRFFSHFGRRLVDIAGVQQGGKVLDVATGRGAVLFPAAERIGPSGWVVGIDLAPSMVEETAREIRRLDVTNAEVLTMDAEHLEFPDETFDAVLCGFGLFFFPNVAAAIGEFRRVLKSGGCIAASTWAKDYYENDRWAWIDELNKKYNVGRKLRSKSLDTPAACEEELRTAGFENVQIAMEQAEFVYTDEEEWWKTHWSHAYRAVLERVPAESLDRYKSEIFSRLQAHKGPHGIREAFPVLFTTGRKPER
jgi:ubiquinone/menaquinone biosynthesis C-methylase UbiE